MTRKQIDKLASSIVFFEQATKDPNLSEEKRKEAESQITQIAMMLSRLPNGLRIMEQIDTIVQSKLESMNIKKEGQ